MPDSVPGAVMAMSPSGRSVVEPSSWAKTSASCQVVISLDSGPKMAHRSYWLRHSMGFSGEVMTARPS